MRILTRTSITWINAKLRILYIYSLALKYQSENSHLRERRIREKMKKKHNINIDLLLIFRATICSNNDKLHGTLVHRTEWLTPTAQPPDFLRFQFERDIHNQNISVLCKFSHLNPWLRGWFFIFASSTHTKNANLNLPIWNHQHLALAAHHQFNWISENKPSETSNVAVSLTLYRIPVIDI